MPTKQTVYSRKTGEAVEMYSVSAQEALASHADEWSSVPVENPPEKPGPKREPEPGTVGWLQGQGGAEKGFGADAAADTKREQEEKAAANRAAQPLNQPPIAQVRPNPDPGSPIDERDQGTAAVLGQEQPGVIPPASAPSAAATAFAEPEKPDDLSKIKGIKGATERGLNDMGIKTYRDLAELTPARAKEIDKQLHLHGRLDRDGWVNQAKALLETTTALRPDKATEQPEPQTDAEQRDANAADAGESDLR